METRIVIDGTIYWTWNEVVDEFSRLESEKAALEAELAEKGEVLMAVTEHLTKLQNEQNRLKAEAQRLREESTRLRRERDEWEATAELLNIPGLKDRVWENYNKLKAKGVIKD